MKIGLGACVASLIGIFVHLRRERCDKRQSFVDFLTRWKGEVLGYPKFPPNFNNSYLDKISAVRGEAETILKWIPKKRHQAAGKLVAAVCGFRDQHTNDSCDTEIKRKKLLAAIDDLIAFTNAS